SANFTSAFPLPPESLLNAPPPPLLSTLSLHDALPIWPCPPGRGRGPTPPLPCGAPSRVTPPPALTASPERSASHTQRHGHVAQRSEEHTSELQSRENLVCRLLLEKKNNPVAVDNAVRG